MVPVRALRPCARRPPPTPLREALRAEERNSLPMRVRAQEATGGHAWPDWARCGKGACTAVVETAEPKRDRAAGRSPAKFRRRVVSARGIEPRT